LAAINESDMLLIRNHYLHAGPSQISYSRDGLCDVIDPVTKQRYDAIRVTLPKSRTLSGSTGVAAPLTFGAEAEFFIFEYPL